MARDWYSNLKQEAYSKWHRQFDGIAMIDVDSVECCKVCYEPLAIIEVAMDKGQDKAYTLIKKIADKMQLPAFVVLYTLELDELVHKYLRRTG